MFDEKLVPVFAEILKRLGRKSAWVVHGETDDGRGMDELSTLGKNTVAMLAKSGISMTTLDGTSLGFSRARIGDLIGGDAMENAGILEGILSCRVKGPKRDIAVLNAAAGFVITGKAADIGHGRLLAEDLLDRGAAHVKLRAMVDWC